MILGVISYFFQEPAILHIYRHYMIKLIKITIKYIKVAHTTVKHNLIIGIPFLQAWWRWHCYSHPNYLCRNIHQVTFDCSTLEVYIANTKNVSWHLEGDKWLRSNCTNSIHVQRDAHKHYFIYPHTILRPLNTLGIKILGFCFLEYSIY